MMISLLRRAVSALLTLFSSSWIAPIGKYRPEDHYMRGPGPKWREKHFHDRTSADGPHSIGLPTCEVAPRHKKAPGDCRGFELVERKENQYFAITGESQCNL
jgi:hypothetical protein